MQKIIVTLLILILLILLMSCPIKTDIQLEEGANAVIKLKLEFQETSIDKKKVQTNIIMEILKWRIQHSNIINYLIEQDEEDIIILKLAGNAEPEIINKIVANTGLEFHIVDKEGSEKFEIYKSGKNEPFLAEDKTTIIDNELADLLGNKVILRKIDKQYSAIKDYTHKVLIKNCELTPEYISETKITNNPLGQPSITIIFNKEGKVIFEK